MCHKRVKDAALVVPPRWETTHDGSKWAAGELVGIARGYSIAHRGIRVDRVHRRGARRCGRSRWRVPRCRRARCDGLELLQDGRLDAG
jgi:hypothetical protein